MSAAGRAALAALLGIAASASLAQDGGLRVTGSLETTLEVDDNPDLEPDSPGTETTLSTAVAVGLVTETATTRIAFEAGGVLQAQNSADELSERNGFVDPFLNFEFDAEGPLTALSLGASLATTDLSDVVLLGGGDGGVVDDDLLASGGELEETEYNFLFVLGVDEPLSAEFSYDHISSEYSDDADPDLSDSTTESYSVVGFGRLSSVATVRAFYAETNYDADNDEQTERVTHRTGIGLAYEISPILRFDGEIAATEVRESEVFPSGPVNLENSGLGFDLSLVRDMPNGAYTLAATHTILTETELTEATLGRAYEFARFDLSYTLGWGHLDGTGDFVIGSLEYSREFPNGLLTASMERGLDVDSENEQRVVTDLGIEYEHVLTRVSSLTFGFDYTRSEVLRPVTGGTSTGGEFSVFYNRDLTEDWDWQIGYRGRFSEDSSGETAHSNAILTTIGRSFSIRP